MSINESLKQPFPYNPSIRVRLVVAVFFGVFVLGFLLIFKPFDLEQFSSRKLFFVALTYGMVTFSCVFAVTALMPIVFPKVFSENVWTTGRQIAFTVLIIFLVGLFNFIVSPLVVDTKLSFRDALWFQGITLAIGILPATVFTLIQQNKLLKKFQGEAAILEKKLKEKDTLVPAVRGDDQALNPRINFNGEYQNEQLEIFADDLHLITSASNYVKLYHLRNEKLIYSIIRCTLRKAEEIVMPYSNFFKCHRAFIINLDKVNHVEGNAQGYKVSIDGYDQPVPISRTLSAEFSDKLLAYRGQKL